MDHWSGDQGTRPQTTEVIDLLAELTVGADIDNTDRPARPDDLTRDAQVGVEFPAEYRILTAPGSGKDNELLAPSV